MSKLIQVLFITLALAFLVSCQTSWMVDPKTDARLSIGEQLAQAGFEEVSISYPTTYYDGQQWCEALTQMVENAQEYIIYTVFLGSECDENQVLIDALKKKAQEGVDVYLVVDGSSGFDMTQSRFHLRPLYDLRKCKVHLLEYKPFSVTRLINLKNIFSVEHRKFLVIDGNQVGLGGMNMNYISLSAKENGGQRDTMYSFKSSDLAKVLVKDFVDFWNKESFEEVSIDEFEIKEKTEEENIKAWFCNQYDKNFDQARMLGVLLNGAKESISCLPFLPMCDKNMLSVMKDAKDRGVDFKMIVSYSRSEDQKRGVQFMMPDLVRTGIDIMVENPTSEISLLHEKLFIIDNLYVGLGSTNFNFRSMNLSNELMLVLESPELAYEVNEHFNQYLENTYKMTQEEADEGKTLKGFPNYVLGLYGG